MAMGTPFALCRTCKRWLAPSRPILQEAILRTAAHTALLSLLLLSAYTYTRIFKSSRDTLHLLSPLIRTLLPPLPLPLRQQKASPT
ncbi:hypothetical protein GQ54DRAFT_297885 [Martensiomyces pterosporus]|nr:hypothetical protein GQ54DRAFT_297885 [Martensiomyces pterosporus]